MSLSHRSIRRVRFNWNCTDQDLAERHQPKNERQNYNYKLELN